MQLFIFIILTVIGLVRGINYGVDFQRNAFQYNFTQVVAAEEIRNVLDEFDLSASTIQRFRTMKLHPDTQLTLDQEISSRYLKKSIGELEIVRNEEVGPTVGGELRRAAYLLSYFLLRI